MRKLFRYGSGCLGIFICLWIIRNSMDQLPQVVPGETLQEVAIWLLMGRPVIGSHPCSAEVHNRYMTKGPDGRLYPTWHPAIDPQTGCYFDHEHGSDPHSFPGFAWSGLPVFGYTARQAGFSESHAGYKVAVADDDLNGHAWMIVYHQDTDSPARVFEQFHTVDWLISDLSGNRLVAVRQMVDFGYAYAHCDHTVIPGSITSGQQGKQIGQKREVLTIACSDENANEGWSGSVDVGDVFEARPSFDVYNPETAIDPLNLAKIYRMCGYYDVKVGCSEKESWQWLGTRRGIRHPGQYVHNSGSETFFTDAYGKPQVDGSPGTIEQYVTRQGWDSRPYAGIEGEFRIQTFSRGVYIAAPKERIGESEFFLAGR